MTATEPTKTHREEIEEDLRHWANQKEHFLKKSNEKGVKVCQLMLDKYLDSLIKLPKEL
jgi:hypothetical protein